MVVILPPTPRPHEVLLLLGSTILGAVYVVGLPPPTSVAAAQPAWVVHLWAGAMLLSGVTGLAAIGLTRRAPVRALRFEGAAMDIGAGALVLYAGSLIAYARLAATAPALTAALWAAANLWRGRQITAQVRAMMRP